ncbi:oligosaccharide repeat unit polymerase [Roseateles oligotrophus]|uniref:Oligosaccharide repeat unit polymerase n=1 Tax=Roseateles oligotrophus TaxID=1769250 RepID=A0ABT2YIH6_9BURK|nr:oligosaccharide repeat unit polymerase [Roseateles oligotrophus]MCV2369877.1 oligosaccharide repeat unit polymerase [Roseateles oligotrophus]
MHARYIWLDFYLLVNVIYFLLILNGGQLYGESNSVTPPAAEAILFLLLLLLTSYAYFQVFLFSSLQKIKIKNVFGDKRHADFGRPVGLIVATLQIGFVVYFMSAGTYVAGSTLRDSSIFSKIWVLIPVDLLFLVFYGTYRDSKYFTFNFFVWIASSLIRGWSGVVLTAIFLESCRMYSAGKVKLAHILYGVIALTIFYPFLLFFKLFIRFLAIGGGDSIQDFFALYQLIDVGDLLLAAMQQAFDRLQLLSSLIASYQFKDIFQLDFDKGLIAPFWYEGIHGIAIDTLFGSPQKISAGQAFAAYLDPFSTDVNWNANPTFVGWLFIAPSLMVFNVLYVTMLCAVSFFATILLRRTDDSLNVIWYSWLVLAIPGWYGALFLYAYSTILFFALHIGIELYRRSFVQHRRRVELAP